MKNVGIILLVLGIVWAVAFVPVMFLGDAYPTAGLIAPLVCGGGSSLVSETTVTETSRRTNVSTGVVCEDSATGEQRSVTSALLILSIVPGALMGTIGLALLNAGRMLGGLGNRGELAAIAQTPEVKARMAKLMEDLKAGRLTYSEYASQSRAIIEEYRARQAQSAPSGQ
jgi:hypothetical protein